MSHLFNSGSLTPSEAYSNSDNDEERYNSPKNLSVLSSVQKGNYDEYPTPPSTEVSNDTDESCSSSTFNNFSNVQYGNINLVPELLNGNKSSQENTDAYQHQNAYNYQIQQYLSNSNLEGYQQGINNELVQPYSIANFDFTSNLNCEQKLADEKNDVSYKDLHKASPKKIEKKKSTESYSTAYLMQPPDSESIAAAAVTARINRNKRRTRIKFEKEQLELLEASFKRTHYPDVNIVDRLSDLIKINAEKISVWFQNRRAKYKKVKKDPKYEDMYQQSPENDPLDLYESAQLEIKEKRKLNENSLNKSQSNEKLNEAQSPKSVINESCGIKTDKDRRSLISEKSNNDNEESNEHLAKQENQIYQPMVRPIMNSSIINPPMMPFHNQNFFQPQLINQQQFYQQEQQFNEAQSPKSVSNESCGIKINSTDKDRRSLESETSNNDNEESNEHLAKQENQIYQPMVRPIMNSSIINPPMIPFHNQNFFQPQLINQQQFYQQEQQFEKEIHLPVKSNENNSQRASLSSVGTNVSRSVSPQSPETEESPIKQELSEDIKFNPIVQPSFNATYPYLQTNMLNNMLPPYNQQNFYDNNSYKQNLESSSAPSGNFSNIFQPYIDCNTSSTQQDNSYMPNFNQNSYVPNFNQMVAPYYQSY